MQRGDFLTIGILVTAFFATNGVEAIRVTLTAPNRVTETRNMFWLRLQGFAFVIISTLAFMTVSTLLVLLPIGVTFAVDRVPQLGTLSSAPSRSGAKHRGLVHHRDRACRCALLAAGRQAQNSSASCQAWCLPWPPG